MLLSQATDAGEISDAHDDHDARATDDVAALGDVLEFALAAAFGTAPRKAEDVNVKSQRLEAATERRRRRRTEDHQAVTRAILQVLRAILQQVASLEWISAHPRKTRGAVQVFCLNAVTATTCPPLV